MRGLPRSRAKSLTINFFAIKDLSGTWRIFQRAPALGTGTAVCRQVLREILTDRVRLPDALMANPGRYRTLTHDTFLERIKQIPGAEILTCRPAYVATLEDTISKATHGHCAKCAVRCPFVGRSQLRQFYDVTFRIS